MKFEREFRYPLREITMDTNFQGISSYFGPEEKLVCTFLNQTVIQIYDQISTPIVWPKVILHRSISLRFGLKEGKLASRNWKQMQPFISWFHQIFLRSKIARNPLKVCKHGYLSNGYQLSFKFQLQEIQKNNIS